MENVGKPGDPAERIVALIDMDCFYAQVEQRDRPELWGKPVAVVQYNTWLDGGLIAVNYEARPFGVKRNGMRGKEAKELCPDLTLVSVPEQRGKANLTKYRNASAEVFRVLNNFDPDITVERASVDEAFLDLSKVCAKILDQRGDGHRLDIEDFLTSHVILEPPDENPNLVESREEKLGRWLRVDCVIERQILRLGIGAEIVERIRRDILDTTHFHCSAGISNNKIVAKLICSFNKLRQQTICPCYEIPNLLKETPIQKVWGFGGKLGRSVTEKYGIQMMGELKDIPLETLQTDFGEKTGSWLRDMGLGMDRDPVKARDLTQSIACSKNFPGGSALGTREEVKKWLGSLTEELEERCTQDQEVNNRTARKFSVGATSNLKNSWSSRRDDVKQFSRQMPLNTYNAQQLARLAYSVLLEFNQHPKSIHTWSPPLTGLFVAAGAFEDCVDVKSHAITDFFSALPPGPSTSREDCGISALREGEQNEILETLKAEDYEMEAGEAMGGDLTEVPPSLDEETPVVDNRAAGQEGTESKKDAQLPMENRFPAVIEAEGEGTECGPSRGRRDSGGSDASLDLFQEMEGEGDQDVEFGDDQHQPGQDEQAAASDQGSKTKEEEDEEKRKLMEENLRRLETDFLPDDFGEMRGDVFKELPFLVQVEIRDWYKVNARGEKRDHPSTIPHATSETSKGQGVQNGQKRTGKKGKAKGKETGKNRSILEYYSKK